MAKKCTHKDAQGKQCKMPALTGKALCLNHDPDYKEQQDANRMKGGMKLKRVIAKENLPKGMKFKFRDANQIMNFNEFLLIALITGELEEAIGRTCCAIIANQLKAMEYRDTLIRNPLPKEGDDAQFTIQDFENTNGEFSDAVEMVNNAMRGLEDKGLEVD